MRTATRDTNTAEVKAKLNIHCRYFAAAQSLQADAHDDPAIAADVAHLYQRAYQELAKFYFWLLPDGLPCD